MRISYRLALILTCILLAAALVYNPSLAQVGKSRYFPETNKTVSGEFLAKYESIRDPISMYGYPITEEYLAQEGSPVNGLRVQYFQRARFEYHPDQPTGQRVVIAPLGTLLSELENPKQTQEINLPTSSACRYFEQSGHRTCYSFLTFFDNNGGLKQFGLPVSPIMKLNDRLVQYFEYARFEWHPNLAVGQRVRLTNIGQIYFDLVERPFAPAQKTPQPIKDKNPIELKVRSFVQSALISKDGKQTVYVVVLDQNQEPLQGAQVTLTLVPSSGQSMNIVSKVTDQNGISRQEIPVSNLPIGMVEVKVKVNYGIGLEKLTVTSFRVWY